MILLSKEDFEIANESSIIEIKLTFLRALKSVKDVTECAAITAVMKDAEPVNDLELSFIYHQLYGVMERYVEINYAGEEDEYHRILSGLNVGRH